jgi:uncharacterized heparinase superfamily protein
MTKVFLSLITGIDRVSRHCESLYGVKQSPVSNQVNKELEIKITHLKDSGYIRVDSGEAVIFLDVAMVGPDYLPGHAHADTLSFEMSVSSQRVIVDSGVSVYEKGQERLRQRGTAAHNTVVINGTDSSEVWDSFRVARRAYPVDLHINEDTKEIACSHTGYCRLSGRPVHNRRWRFLENSVEITDAVKGDFTDAKAFIHLNPDVKVKADADASNCGIFMLPDGKRLEWIVEGGDVRIIDTTYHPEFGMIISNKCLEISLSGRETTFKTMWR